MCACLLPCCSEGKLAYTFFSLSKQLQDFKTRVGGKTPRTAYTWQMAGYMVVYGLQQTCVHTDHAATESLTSYRRCLMIQQLHMPSRKIATVYPSTAPTKQTVIHLEPAPTDLHTQLPPSYWLTLYHCPDVEPKAARSCVVTPLDAYIVRKGHTVWEKSPLLLTLPLLAFLLTTSRQKFSL